ncbi:MAG: mandelate racemase/muconate lactonizing enzyme family protein [Desulfurococcaceae archaeon]
MIDFVILKLPTSHFISGWKPIRESWHLITFVRTEDSVYGVGEGTPYGTNIFEDYSTIVKLRRMIIGYSLDEALRALKEYEYHILSCTSRVTYGAFLSLESAILDALAKRRKTSIAHLLGGEYRDKVPVVGTVFLKHPFFMVEELNKWISKGVRHIKIKIPCNLDDLERTLRIIRDSLKETDIILRVDANQCLENYEKAVKAFRIMERYNIDIVEQPLPKNALKETAKLRKVFHPSIKIMLDESLTRPQDIELFAELEVADIVNFHPSKLGCLRITRETAMLCKKMGIDVQIGSALMTEIGLIHYLNLATSIPGLNYPLEEVGLHNTSYGYSILCNPSVLSIDNGFLNLKPHIEIKSLCLSYVDIFSISQMMRRYVPKYMTRTTLSNLIAKVFRATKYYA